MQTIWQGVGIPAANMVWTEVFLPKSRWITLSDTPGAVTRVTLPVATHGVTLWTSTEVIWYALDDAPGPIPPPASGTLLDASVFVFGAVLLPGTWQLFALPDDSLQHDVQLVSQAQSPTVLLTALTEII